MTLADEIERQIAPNVYPEDPRVTLDWRHWQTIIQALRRSSPSSSDEALVEEACRAANAALFAHDENAFEHWDEMQPDDKEMVRLAMRTAVPLITAHIDAKTAEMREEVQRLHERVHEAIREGVEAVTPQLRVTRLRAEAAEKRLAELVPEEVRAQIKAWLAIREDRRQRPLGQSQIVEEEATRFFLEPMLRSLIAGGSHAG